MNGSINQLFIDPAPCSERDINLILTHQIVKDRVRLGIVPSLIKRDGFIFENAAIPNDFKSCRNRLFRLSVEPFTELLFLTLVMGLNGFILFLPFRPIYRREFYAFGKFVHYQRTHEVRECLSAVLLGFEISADMAA